MKQKYLIGIGLVFLLVVGGYLLEYRSEIVEYPRAVEWSQETYVLEIADTDMLRERGLGGREAICSHCGMLFVFPRAEAHGFWMKEMRFALDIVWLHQDEVVHIERRIDPRSVEIFRPMVGADRVIEVRAGGAETLQVGNHVRYVY